MRYALTARVQDAQGQTIPGTRGLSMFYMRVRNPDDNKLNGIEVIRLKDKLGTRQLPTAELLLDGAVAHRVRTVTQLPFCSLLNLNLCY